MKNQKLMQKLTVMVLALSVIVGCGFPAAIPTPTATPTPDMTPGQIKGVFVDKATGQPVELTPNLFDFDLNYTEDEIATRRSNKIEIETDSSGAFTITNVLPGKYALMIGYEGVDSVPVFTVSPGQVVDLGTVEVEQ